MDDTLSLFPEPSGKDPQRRCITTRQVMDKAQLLRFVASPDGGVVYDAKETLPGRGMWVSASRAAVEEAVSKNLFAKSAKAKLKAAPELVDEVERQLLQQVYRYIERAAVSGELICGFEKLSAALQAGEIRLLIHAEEAQPDGCRKLDKYAEELRILRFGQGEALQKATKRGNPVHMGLKSPKLSLALQAAHDRWAGFSRRDTV